MSTEKNFVTVDGNEAAAYIAYAFSEVAAIYPITPSSPMAGKTDVWSAKGKRNMFGQTVRLVEMQAESGAIAAASVTFAVAALSDGLDGFLARRLGQESRLGALLDPVGDKLLSFAALVVLVVSGALPLWLLIASLLRDGVVLTIALICLVRRCPTERDPMRMGKLATLCTNAAVLLALAHTLWPLASVSRLLTAFSALAATCLCLAAIGYAARALGAKFAPMPPLAKSDACRERNHS